MTTENAVLTLQDIYNRLIAEGYENIHEPKNHQIIVNKRGEIDECWPFGTFTLYSRVPDYGQLQDKIKDIDVLFQKIASVWTKHENI